MIPGFALAGSLVFVACMWAAITAGLRRFPPPPELWIAMLLACALCVNAVVEQRWLAIAGWLMTAGANAWTLRNAYDPTQIRGGGFRG